jgi:galactose oxidase
MGKRRWVVWFGFGGVAAMVASGAAAQVTTSVNVVSTGQCMDVNGATQLNGEAIIQWGCNGGGNQQWTLRDTGGGVYSFTVSHSGQCLDIFGGNTAAGTQAIQWPCGAQANQRFSLRAQGAGYAIVAQHSGLCLGVEGASATQGARITQQACNGSTAQTFRLPALQNRGTVGQWTAPQNLSIVPVAAANLPDGRVLFWSAYERLAFGGDNGRTYTVVYNPATGAASETLVSNTGHDMFCPGTANLADGRIHVTGGSSSAKTSIYNPATGTWSASSAMGIARGYQGNATLSTGDVFTIGGSWSGGQGNKDAEVWSAATGAWRRSSGVWDDFILTADRAGVYRSDNHAWLFAASGGRIFHAGPSRRMNWFGTGATGSVTNAGNRGNDGDAMNGNAVMFRANQILTTGGAPNYDSIDATRNAHVIDIGTTPVTVRQVASMAYARAYHNSVPLPDGRVLVVGGQSYPVPFSDDRAVLVPELWNPNTEQFAAVAPMAVPRTYHSVAILLPDGRVLSGGGGLCGGCTTNHPNVQIYSPPYLFNADGTPAARPVINSAPATATVGTTINVATNSAVNRIVFMRLSSVTHSVNNEQRRISLTPTATGTNTYSVALPASRGTLVPGYYMMFALNAAGVPSVSRTVRIQ